MRHAQRITGVWLLVFLAGGSVSAWAQQVQGSFTGTVTDASGGVVPRVTVTAIDKDTGFTRSAATGHDGVYLIPLLPPGQYTLTAERQGFEKYSEGPIALTVNQQAKVDLQLTVGAASTTVSVEATAPVLDTQTSSVGTTVEGAKVSQLPFNGRQFLQATLFTPGVVSGSQGSELNSNRGGSINVNGMRESMNTFLLDGMNDTTIAVGTYSATPPLDSIQEFRMETGVYDARFGTNAGAQVNVVTKSGTNEFHGSLYEYLRNSNLDARNFFEPYVPPFHRNQFGASVGGPLSIPGVYDGHSRTFFFLNYEGLRDRHDFFARGHVPTPTELTGDFSDVAPGSGCPTPALLINPIPLLTQGQVVPFTSFSAVGLPVDPVGAAFASVYPAPNIPGVPGNGPTCGQENYTAVVGQKVYTNDYVGRFDHRWGKKDSAFFRYNLTTDSEFAPSGLGTVDQGVRALPSGVPGFGTFRTDWFTATGIDWTHTFSPTLLNEAKVDYNRWQYLWNNQDQGQYFGFKPPFNIQGIPTAFRDTGLPNIGLSDTAVDSVGASTSQPQAGAVNTFEFADTLTQIHGNHSFAYGVQIRSIKRGNFYIDEYARSNFVFRGLVSNGFNEVPPQLVAQGLGLPANTPLQLGNGLADLLLGIPTSWVNGYSQYISGTAGEYDFFAQDTWKARRNLTLTLGLRYEYNSLATEKANRFGGFDFSYSQCPNPANPAQMTQGAVLVAGTSAAGIDCFTGTIGAAGNLGGFTQVGTTNLGGSSENRALQEPDHKDIGPRIGFAWQPFGDTRTVIRGGVGIYYDQMTGELYFQKSANPPFVRIEVGDLQDEQSAIPLFLSELGTGKVIGNAFTQTSAPLFPVLEPVIVKLQDSRVYEWSLDVQREFPGSWLVDVAYVGTRGTHLPWFWNPNQPNNALFNPSASYNAGLPSGQQTCVAGTSPGTPCPRPYQEFLDMTYTDSSGYSTYHSLQVKVERHFSRDLALIGSYTYAKTLDTNSTYDASNASENSPQNDYNLAADYGRADFDYRHRFSLAYIYNFPFGRTVAHLGNSKLNYLIQDWQLAGIVFAQSGAPFTAELGENISNANDSSSPGQDRPSYVGGPVYPATRTVNQWVLASAFEPCSKVLGTPYCFGNVGRNTLNGPGEGDWDFSIVRDFRLSEHKRLEFRAEMFNVLNRANFNLPNSNLSSPNFGVINNTVQPIAGQASGGPGEPREIQFALRLKF
ncbi:MAG TPA: TonB-dependent receptor [Terriglobia bacterium]|nr:TonB-dependent receptor [Terriglobia bacterium]